MTRLLTPLAMAVLGAALLAWSMASGSGASFVFPSLAAGAMLVTGVLASVAALVAARAPAQKNHGYRDFAEADRNSRGHLVREGAVGAIVAVYGAVAASLGFYLAGLVAFAVVALIARDAPRDRGALTRTLAGGLGLMLVLYALFALLLRVQTPVGLAS